MQFRPVESSSSPIQNGSVQSSVPRYLAQNNYEPTKVTSLNDLNNLNDNLNNVRTDNSFRNSTQQQVLPVRQFNNRNTVRGNNFNVANSGNQDNRVGQNQQQQQQEKLPPLAFESTAAQQLRGSATDVKIDLVHNASDKLFDLAKNIGSVIVPGDVMIHEALEFTFHYTKQSSKRAFNTVTKMLELAYSKLGTNTLSKLDEGTVSFLISLNKLLVGLSLLILRETQFSGSDKGGFGGIREARNDEHEDQNMKILNRSVRRGLMSVYILTYPHIFPDIEKVSMISITDYCFTDHKLFGYSMWYDMINRFVRLYYNKRFRSEGRVFSNELYINE